MLPYEGVDLEFSLEGKTAVITGGAVALVMQQRSSSMKKV